MFKHIENLRSKPEHTRRKILVFSVGFFMFFIVIIWGLSFSARFELFNNTKGVQSKALSPFSVISGYFEEFSDGARQTASSLMSNFPK